MKHILKRIVVSLCTLCTVCLLLSLLISSHAVAKRFSSDVPQEVQTKILELENAIGIDIQSEIITKSYSDHMIDTLLSALDNQYVDVKARSLTLLAEVIKQLDVHKTTIDQKIKPAINLFIEGRISSVDKAESMLVQLAKRVLWQMKIKEISDDKERLGFLKDNIENTTDGYYYSFEAMDYLVEMGSKGARKVLEEKLNERAKRSIPKDIIDNLMVRLEKIEVIQSVENLDAHSKAKQLRDLIFKLKEEQGLFKRDFLIWAIRQLEKIDSPTAILILKDIWHDKTFKDDYRYEAQEILVRLKKIREKERTILFEF